MEEGHQRPPRNHVEAVDKVGHARVFLAVILACSVHPLLHLLEGITSLVIAPITIHQATESNSNRPEIVLEAGVVASGRGILVDDYFRPIHIQPNISLPSVRGVVGSDQSPHLLL